ncbi:glycosyltransferase [Candidatus Sulfidibacterium hydrothermale]|uniref:glycosyltransferase family 2 protein n=1 Tax=Candidatus Sulfidibacterium hydrothermale TaxID=2875962 RepID=UPI001F0ADECF|nr:glycosyltransferase [Candidatus Sulfidibacterium hydrothermale]UBM62024.1 glycosyltransferase [Candidatus Sulfidibacterium hydrothermale]
MVQSRIYIALPVLNESYSLPRFLSSIQNQTFQDFSLTVCVNQYDNDWNDPERKKLCEDNRKSLRLLQQKFPFPVEVIDRTSPGKGWPPRKGGVGFARKMAMDQIAAKAKDTDIIVSMDADTEYPPEYLSAIIRYFQDHPCDVGLSLPYYHRLTGDEWHDRLLLRYELYMRYYALNMIRIKNPYRFTALGSAMAFPVWAYRKVSGLTPVQSGEDFYFLQKLVKNGPLGYWAPTTAYPSARFSDRVNFGTGPALIKGRSGHWDSYPFYPSELFDQVEQTYALFPALFEKDLATPMDTFLKQLFKTEALWSPLRKNFKSRKNFVKACQNKVDGLRILQFLKQHYQGSGNDVKPLTGFLRKYFPEEIPENRLTELETKGFEKATFGVLASLRDKMFALEGSERAKDR